ncbi:hypothetical protein BT93_L1294 [Corymbia citriodora subsp. variegata]|uniref:Cytochrome P450 n=1 Tax=Corymbia citriodora subsp. variegata TaxID=360336 RepID=A0A8T0CSY6_CORYI|nr:hypothetical protein BT93_L1294 [Corymbia citriodora subsp. variegata]
MSNDLVSLSLSLFLFLSLALIIKTLHKLWWNPLRIQGEMAAQGIGGPPYRFFHGSTKEMLQMKRKVTKRSMNLSHDIFPYVQPHLYEWTKTYGRNFLMWYGTQAFLVISDLEMVKEVLNNRDDTYSKESCPRPSQEVHRRRACDFSRWSDREGKEIDAYKELRLYALEVISKTAFGSSYIEGKSIFENVNKLILVMVNASSSFPMVRKLWKPAYEIEGEKIERGFREAVLEIIKKRQEKVNSGELENYGNDFLGLLLRASHEIDEKKRITIDNVVSECKTFYIAGHETATSFLAWTVFLLSIHTDWQQEARKEVLNVFENQDPDLDGITKLKTIGMIINESLRLYPPATFISRKVSRQAKLGNLILPAGIKLHIPTLKIHHDPQMWGHDAHLFKPERFADGVSKATSNNPATFLPFSLGPRSCIGSNFVLVEAKVVLSMILQRYAFTLSPAYVHSPAQLLIAYPKYGVQIFFNPI